MKTSIELLEPYPEKDDRDFGYRVARSTLGSMPFVGPQLSELVDACVGQPLQNRRDKWFILLHGVLEEVRKKIENFTPEKLANDEEFVTVVQRATDVALRNHRAEKLMALENVVYNAAFGLRLDEVLRDTFFGLLDRFSTWHIKLLLVLHSPMKTELYAKAVNRMTTGSPSQLLKGIFPELDATVLAQIIVDLTDEKLSTSLDTMISERSLRGPFTTEKGKTFVNFITKREH